ncbi:MAG TPA: chemotaxis protein CheW [Candidatus Didemnitutus sp.]|nr:chemotaxis protein CheW [Candidatus Didemnitutus sp.]
MSSTNQESAVRSNRVEKYLTVLLDGEAYGIAALKVREIIRHQPPTPLPQMPEFVKGVINLRGRVIPVTDLRVKFGLKAACDDRTCIVIVQVAMSEGRSMPMGLIVDMVEEVANIPLSEIEPTPEFGVNIDTSGLQGMAKVGGRVKTLLDIDHVVASETIAALAASR